MPHQPLLWWLRAPFTTSSMRRKIWEYELSFRGRMSAVVIEPTNFKQRPLGCAFRMWRGSGQLRNSKSYNTTR